MCYERADYEKVCYERACCTCSIGSYQQRANLGHDKKKEVGYQWVGFMRKGVMAVC